MSYYHHDDVLPEDFSGGIINWRLRVIHWAGKIAGLLVKVEGFPYGSSRNRKEFERAETGSSTRGLVGNAAEGA